MVIVRLLCGLSATVVLLAGATTVTFVGCGGGLADEPLVGTRNDAGLDATVTDAMNALGDGDVADVHDDRSWPPLPPPSGPRLVDTLCNRLAECCGPSTFDMSACLVNPPVNPSIAALRDMEPFLDGGHITFDLLSAQSCIDKIKGLTCGVATSMYVTALLQACYAAAKGNIPLGGPCSGSPECSPPNHCEALDGSSACVAPRAIGALCATHDECGQLRTGVPGYCDTLANNFGGNDACETQKDLDAGCREAIECRSNICGPALDPAIAEAGAGQCALGLAVASVKTCAAYELHD